ncbi:MAG: cupin domain-containing protein [Planctomycetota bacterium]|jgi:quercetin dioxygenase-like cupin family protein
MLFTDMNSSARYKVWLTGFALVVFAVAGCSTSQKGMKDMNVSKIDAQILATLVQDSAEVEKVDHSWGWLQWLMNDKIDPQAAMTFGLVQINAGKENPMHIHPNCEEILYMVSGSCDHRIGDQTVKLQEGQIIRIPAGVPHRAKTSGAKPMKAVIVYSSGNRQFVVVEK